METPRLFPGARSLRDREPVPDLVGCKFNQCDLTYSPTHFGRLPAVAFQRDPRYKCILITSGIGEIRDGLIRVWRFRVDEAIKQTGFHICKMLPSVISKYTSTEDKQIVKYLCIIYV